MRIVVVGAGIAGLSAAALLARRNHLVTVVDEADGPGRRSTARSAAIFRLAVAEPINVRLALRSRVLARTFRDGLYRTVGGLYPCDDAATRDAILAAAKEAGVREAVGADFPDWLARRDRCGAWSPDDAVVDVNELVLALRTGASRCRAVFRFGGKVAGIDVEAGTVRGVRVGDERLSADVVVDATGAFGGDTIPGDVGVRPHRRHVYVLEGPTTSRVDRVVWDLDDALYVRPDDGGVLACPCDETPWNEVDPTIDPDVEASLLRRMRTWAPGLGDLRVTRRWVGLRPLTSDHRFVVGPDPRLRGLVRLTGFGGHGITAGLAAGELVARLVDGHDVPELAELRPGR